MTKTVLVLVLRQVFRISRLSVNYTINICIVPAVIKQNNYFIKFSLFMILLYSPTPRPLSRAAVTNSASCQPFVQELTVKDRQKMYEHVCTCTWLCRPNALHNYYARIFHRHKVLHPVRSNFRSIFNRFTVSDSEILLVLYALSQLCK